MDTDPRPPAESGSQERWRPPQVGPESGPMLTARQLEELQRQAWDEAFAQGRQAGYEEGKAQASAEAAQLARIARALCRPFERLDLQVEQELVALSIAIASQVVHQEIRSAPEQIVHIVREAVAALPVNSGEITIYLCVADAALVRDALVRDNAPEGWRIAEDSALAPGDCRVRCDYSHVDATLQTRLERVVAQLLDASGDPADESKVAGE